MNEVPEPNSMLSLRNLIVPVPDIAVSEVVFCG
jgi:hypothetical protein